MRLSGNTDCHTSDIGHWFAMTETNFVYSLNPPCMHGGFVLSFFDFLFGLRFALFLVRKILGEDGHEIVLGGVFHLGYPV